MKPTRFLAENSHHGSANATTADLLARVTPWLSVISVGDWNYGRGTTDRFTTWYYGHPRETVVDLLCNATPYGRVKPVTAKVVVRPMEFKGKRVKKALYATAWDGNIAIMATLARNS